MEVTKSEWLPKYGNYTILLKETMGKGYYPVFVDELEAELVKALNNQKSLLPYKATRLLPLLLRKTKIEVLKIEIFKNFFGNVFAKVVFSNQKKTKKLTCDLGVAIELALRFDVPIFIEKPLLFESQPAGQNPRYLLNELESLKSNLQKAIEMEEYEKAAKLRDTILKLEKESKIKSAPKN